MFYRIGGWFIFEVAELSGRMDNIFVIFMPVFIDRYGSTPIDIIVFDICL